MQQPTPFERALREPAFLAAVARELPTGTVALDALRWLDDPTAPAGDGRPGPGVAVEEARAGLYRPGADEALRERHGRLAAALAADQDRTRAALHRVSAAEREELEHARGEPPTTAVPVPEPPTGASAILGPFPRWEARRRRPTRRLLVLVAALVVVLAGAGLARMQQGGSASRASPSATAAAPLPLARLIDDEPERLPTAWRGAALVTSSDVLDGAAPLSAPDGHRQSRLLLVVRCPASDRSFQAVVSDTSVAPQYGACGRLQAVELPPRLAGPVRVVVTTRGVQPFSGALLQR